MKNQNQWNEIFCTNVVNPNGRSSLIVSKIKPDGDGARSIYNDDKEMIHKAANKYGFKVLDDNKKQITFLKVP